MADSEHRLSLLGMPQRYSVNAKRYAARGGLIRLAENQWIVYSGGEPCIEWRAKISQWLAPRRIVAWGYSQEARAYLPTETMLPEGGYEVLESNLNRESTPAPFAPGIERAVRESLLRQLAFIAAKPD